MKKRLAIIGIIVEDNRSARELNELLHDHQQVIVGRLGLPYKDRQLGVISIIVDADSNTINTLSGKLGMLPGVNAKTMYAKVSSEHE